MPSLTRSGTTPIVVKSRSPRSRASSFSSGDSLSVKFKSDPVTSVSRPFSDDENDIAEDFERHARSCDYCHDPYEVHRKHQRLCDRGHVYAQELARYIYAAANGDAYSTREEDSVPVRVEIPAAFKQVKSLLKAVERSQRRSRTPFLSQDRTYYVAERTPKRTRSVKIEQPKTKPSRPVREIVEWPTDQPLTKTYTEAKPKSQKVKVYTEVATPISRSKRGSLYVEDLANQRRDATQYYVEVREPSASDIREHRRSGYYR
ncbi:hypothetical protein B0J11DRAFT_64349 [Dendryphion nanum]|uniref:Uncharacterized protein n=1 Tax=Dendryphion nanum TaxID=256645 RepID=A0A9P9DI22_9PLEO|nr:hypothetical protein B0J11DRAFT_64349 [Dendryphion nanum]